jgi:cell division protein FtsI (penicillin-binding protein 3)
MEQPQNYHWGSVVAAPLFRDIVKELVIYLDIPPEDAQQNLVAKEG